MERGSGLRLWYGGGKRITGLNSYIEELSCLVLNLLAIPISLLRGIQKGILEQSGEILTKKNKEQDYQLQDEEKTYLTIALIKYLDSLSGEQLEELLRQTDEYKLYIDSGGDSEGLSNETMKLLALQIITGLYNLSGEEIREMLITEMNNSYEFKNLSLDTLEKLLEKTKRHIIYKSRLRSLETLENEDKILPISSFILGNDLRVLSEKRKPLNDDEKKVLAIQVLIAKLEFEDKAIYDFFLRYGNEDQVSNVTLSLLNKVWEDGSLDTPYLRNAPLIIAHYKAQFFIDMLKIIDGKKFDFDDGRTEGKLFKILIYYFFYLRDDVSGYSFVSKEGNIIDKSELNILQLQDILGGDTLESIYRKYQQFIEKVKISVNDDIIGRNEDMKRFREAGEGKETVIGFQGFSQNYMN